MKDLILGADMREPLIVEWVLDRLQDRKERDPETAREIEARCFGEENIRYLLDHGAPRLLTRIFRIVSTERFAPVGATLVEKWSQWRGVTALWSAPVMAACLPDAAAAEFDRYVQTDTDQFRDLEKWHGMLKGLLALPTENAGRIAASIVAAYRRVSGDSMTRSVFSVYMVALALTYDLPEFETLLKEYLQSGTWGRPTGIV